MRTYLFLSLLSLLLLTPAYVSFRRQMRKVKKEVFGLDRGNHKKDIITEEPGSKIKIAGIPFIYVVIFLFLMWGLAVGYYVKTEILG